MASPVVCWLGAASLSVCDIPLCPGRSAGSQKSLWLLERFISTWGRKVLASRWFRTGKAVRKSLSRLIRLSRMSRKKSPSLGPPHRTPRDFHTRQMLCAKPSNLILEPEYRWGNSTHCTMYSFEVCLPSL